MESGGRKRQLFNRFLLSYQIFSLEVKAFHTGLSVVLAPHSLPGDTGLVWREWGSQGRGSKDTGTRGSGSG